MAKKKALPSRSTRGMITAATLIIGIAAFYIVVVSGLPAATAAIAAIVLLFVVSGIIIQANGLRNMFGAYLLGGKSGINLIDKISRWNPRFWIAFADWGIAVSFGFISYFVFRKQISKGMLALGLASIIGIMYFFIPNYGLALQFINLPQIFSLAPQQPVLQPQFTAIFFILLALILFGGFVMLIIGLLMYAAGTILYGLALFLASVASSSPNYSTISSQIPGVAPLLPGITLPLAAGLVTLAIILIVHEFSHGILARVAKVKIKEIGLLVLGFIPIGAFVDPDDKQVKRLSPEHQSRILLAGVSANMLTAIITFILLLAVITYILPGFISEKVIISAVAANAPAFGIIQPGSQILQWNDHAIKNLSQLEALPKPQPFSSVNVVTDKGQYSIISNSSGKIGINLLQSVGPSGGIASSAVYFVYVVLALSFLLNFFVAVFNLLPLPGLDGWQIFKLKLKNTKSLRILAIVILAAILVNIIPWFYPH
ncbi:MAG: site-2 protease family protein [Candidatus Micrarchaeota archaeon]|nr:site-2 protease family protein [Candidatus Micrarchaeota archaeon]